MSAARQRGFTLAELMIALLVFTFVAGVGVYTLRLGVEARDQLEQADAGIRDIELMRVLIKNDLLQIVARPVRREFGERSEAWFYGGASHPDRPDEPSETQLMSFVRAGWINPEADEPRSSLQFVQYLAREGSLVRRARPFLDDARDQPSADRILLDGLDEVRIEFLRGEVNGRFDWVEDWPTAGAPDPSPRVVALTLIDRRYGEVRHLFRIPDVREVAS